MSEDLYRIRPFCDWHEDHGDVLWWRIPISEAPYVGSPLDLGRQMVMQVCVGRELHQSAEFTTGGWPFDESDHRNLWWSPLPDARRIEDQVPL